MNLTDTRHVIMKFKVKILFMFLLLLDFMFEIKYASSFLFIEHSNLPIKKAFNNKC